MTDLNYELEKSQERCKFLEDENEKLAKCDIGFYKERLMLLEQDFDNNKVLIDRLTREKDDEIAAHNMLRTKIRDLEDDLAATKRERDDTMFEAQRVKDQAHDFDRQFEDVKKETLKVRNEFETGV